MFFIVFTSGCDKRMIRVSIQFIIHSFPVRTVTQESRIMCRRWQRAETREEHGEEIDEEEKRRTSLLRRVNTWFLPAPFSPDCRHFLWPCVWLEAAASTAAAERVRTMDKIKTRKLCFLYKSAHTALHSLHAKQSVRIYICRKEMA